MVGNKLPMGTAKDWGGDRDGGRAAGKKDQKMDRKARNIISGVKKCRNIGTVN